METTKDSPVQRKNTKAGISTVTQDSPLLALLNDPSYGLRLKGAVITAGDLSTFKGEKDGRSYSITSKRFDIACGQNMIECGFRKDDDNDIPDLSLGDVIEVDVSYARTQAGKISVNGKLLSVNGVSVISPS